MLGEKMRGEIVVMQSEFRRRGFFRPATTRILAEWLYNLALTLGGLGIWLLFEPWWIKGAGLLISTLGLTGIMTCTHTAAHGTALPWQWANSALAYFGNPFMAMVSADYWRHKHNVVHHPNPNVVGVDNDCDLMPFFALNESEVLGASPVMAFYYRHVQGWVFPLAVTLNGFNVQRASWVHLVGRLLDHRTRRPEHLLDMCVMLGHVGVWIILPCMFLSVAEGLLLYFLRIGAAGHFMFCAFAPAHFPAEASLLEVAAAERDVAMGQTQTTLNFRTGLIGGLMCNGVQHQIEHHLFPHLCHVYYPKIAPLVKDLCYRNGYPYRTLGWSEAILKSYAALFRLKGILGLATPNEPVRASIEKV